MPFSSTTPSPAVPLTAHAALPWWRRIRMGFGVVIASLVVGALLLMAALLALQARSTTRNAILAASTENAQHIGRLLSERVRRVLEPADVAMRLLAHDPLTQASTLPDRLERLPALHSLLQEQTLLSAVFVGYPDGQFILLRPLRDPVVRSRLKAPESARYLLQSIAREPGQPGLVGRWAFYTADMERILSDPRPDYRFDPRGRPWYTAAVEQRGQVLTPPYVFFTTREIGLTLSQPSHDGRAVVGMDLALPDFGRELNSLRPLPLTQLVIVNRENQVLAHPEIAQSRLLAGADGEAPQLPSVASLGSPSLNVMLTLPPQAESAHHFRVDGQEWLGQVQPLSGLRWEGLRLLVAVPSDALLAEVNQGLARQVWLSAAIIALLLSGGWWAGRRLGRQLEGLSLRTRALSRFDFESRAGAPSQVREVHALGKVLDDMAGTIQQFLEISQHISADTRLDVMLSRVLFQLVRAMRCTSGAVYLVQEPAHLLERVGRFCEDPDEQGQYPDQLGMAQFINAASLQEGDSTLEGGLGARRVLRIPLHTRGGLPLGLLILRFPADVVHDGGNFKAFAEKLSGTLAVAIETRQLIEGQKELLDAVIRMLADVIDAKSPTTGRHCERVPELAEMLVQRLCETTEGPYAQVRMTEAERYEFRLGAWLHDCGKVTTPEAVLDKATKLETQYNRIHEVRMRFEVLWRDALIEALQQQVQGDTPTEVLQRTLAERRRQLQTDFAFVAQCNLGSETLSNEAVDRLRRIGRQTWMRFFDDRLGLSATELAHLAAFPKAQLPALEKLLADRPEHIVPWGERLPPVERGDPANLWDFDMPVPPQAAHLGELHNLSVRRGTLTEEERFKINEHIVQTIVMLSTLPFPPHLARVPRIAGTHHEKLDGTGYPRRLRAEQLTLTDRVMALADVFEALTAGDRPYKTALTVGAALALMVDMVQDQHLDRELFRFFLRSGVWRDYAERFLTPVQRDAVDVDALEKRLGPVTASSAPVPPLTLEVLR